MSRENRHSCAIALLVAIAALAFGALSAVRRPADLVILASAVAPAVVAIECRTMPEGPGLFGTSRHATSFGSGVVVDPSGLVVTNFHVVRDALSIRVTLHTGMSVPATLVGSDEAADLAVLRLIGVSGLPHLRIGRAEGLRIGQRVVSLGNAHGHGASGEPSMTTGIVSGRHRRVMGLECYEMDAQIYPGSSGGPVCDMSGEVVGINVALSSHLKSFFIPLDAARRAVLGDISGGLIGPSAGRP